MSHPSWVCGLKPRLGSRCRLRPCVTPFVGVWIETFRQFHRQYAYHVTPFVGVWIETSKTLKLKALMTVTPFVGVWIETMKSRRLSTAKTSHTLRGCVDWNIFWNSNGWPTFVTPFVGVWIETSDGSASTFLSRVTPFVGVWNETENRFYFLSPLEKVIFTKTCHWLSISYKDKKYDSGLF